MIDYGMILFDERERVLFPLHINSLRHYMPNMFNIKVSVRPEDSEGIALCESFGVEVLPHPVYVQSPGKDGIGLAGFDVANRMDLLMKACTSDWVVISHLDIIWTGNMMLRAKQFMTDEYGILGCHPHGSFAINRKAYGECHAGFWHYSFSGQYWTNEHDYSWLRLTGIGPQKIVYYPEYPGASFFQVVIPSVDVGCMVEIEMQSYTYKILREAIAYYHHVGGGSYHSRGGVADFAKDADGNVIPLNEDELVSHKIVKDNVQRALTDYARFK